MKKIHHFIVKNFFPVLGEQEILNKNIVHQIKNVLNLKTGEEVIVNDGEGKELRAAILQINREKLVINGFSVNDISHESKRLIRLYCSILKGDHFEWVVEKATELGIDEIVPLVTYRTVKMNIRLERLEKIAQEAAEQCERGIVPVIRRPIKYTETITDTFKKNTAFVFDMYGSSFLGFSMHKSIKEINLLIGPEGGWSKEELELAQKHGISIVSLGGTILRAETAAIASCFWASRVLV